jgi:hypothetical protein
MTNKSFVWFPRVAAFFFGLTLLGACDVAPPEPGDETPAADTAQSPDVDQSVDSDQPALTEASAKDRRACGAHTCGPREMCCSDHCVALKPNQVNFCRTIPHDPPFNE